MAKERRDKASTGRGRAGRDSPKAGAGDAKRGGAGGSGADGRGNRLRRIVARSQRELGKLHGVSQNAVCKWVQDVRWREAGFSVRGPWSVGDVERQRAWRAEQLREDPAVGGGGGAGASGSEAGFSINGQNLGQAKQIAQIKVLVEREANLRVDRLIKERDYVRRAEAEESTAAKLRSIKHAVLELPRSLRQLLADATDPAKCEELLAGALRAIFVTGTADAPQESEGGNQ